MYLYILEGATSVMEKNRMGKRDDVGAQVSWAKSIFKVFSN